MKKRNLLMLSVLGAMSVVLLAVANPNERSKARLENSSVIIVVDQDANSSWPITNAEFAVRRADTGELLEIMTTDAKGKAVTSPLPIGQIVTIQQNKVPYPYTVKNSPIRIKVSATGAIQEVSNSVPAHIQLGRSSSGELTINKIRMSVPTVKQHPELPNGCEIVSLTAMLQFYGFPVSKLSMADQYLPKQAFEMNEDTRVGPNPEVAYAGNPRDATGYFSYVPPIVQAANNYFATLPNHRKQAIDATGMERAEMIKELSLGHPVMIWTTLDFSKPRMSASWYVRGTGDYFVGPSNLHAMVLTGYDGNRLFAMDPLAGQTSYDTDKVFQSYRDMGMRALQIVDK